MKKSLLFIILTLISAFGIVAQDKLNIVCSFSDFAAIAKEIAKDKGEVTYIAQGDLDPHFVPPKPSFAMLLKEADLWVTTGLDLEVWSATLLDKARNKNIMDGAPGFVSASAGVNLIEKISNASRSEGDIHMMGNPHIHTSPVNWKIIARNITIGLCKIDPANQDFYTNNLKAFNNKVDEALFGKELVKIFGGDQLCKLLDNNTLSTFLNNEYQGQKLSNLLGGWLKKAESLRGKKVIAYHKNWSYLAKTYGFEIVGFIEPKPGIPPSAKHVQDMIQLIKEQDIKVMMVASYFEKKSPQMIEEKTGIKAVFLPLQTGNLPELSDNFKLMDYWLDQLINNIK